jgi:predicted MPP superfamily phosphohydrolase
MKRVVSRFHVESDAKQGNTLTLGFVSDLHNGNYRDWLSSLSGVDAILVAGDILDRHRAGVESASGFIQDAPEIAPVFLSLGNHETRSEEWKDFRNVVKKSRVRILDDQYIDFKGLIIGGLTSREKESHRLAPELVPDMKRFVDDMASHPGFKILMCHHPEYYDVCVRGHGIDLTLAGHAHGGQVQLFGQGLYAPGQGLFPKYTHGFYDGNHLLVNRGVTNSTWAPRWWNPCEVILLTVMY